MDVQKEVSQETLLPELELKTNPETMYTLNLSQPNPEQPQEHRQQKPKPKSPKMRPLVQVPSNSKKNRQKGKDRGEEDVTQDTFSKQGQSHHPLYLNSNEKIG